MWCLQCQQSGKYFWVRRKSHFWNLRSFEIFTRPLSWIKLEQVERLRYDDTLRRLTITHTIESYWIPSQKKTKSKLQIQRNRQIFIFSILKQSIQATHLLMLLDKMCKYEMDPTSIVEDTERTRVCPQTDRRTDRQTDKVKPVYPLSTSLKRGVKLY